MVSAPGATASWSVGAASVGRGSSPSSMPRFAGARSGRSPAGGRWPRSSVVTWSSSSMDDMHPTGDELRLSPFRKHLAWYLKGYPVGPAVRRDAGQVATVADLERLLSGIDVDALPVEGAERMVRSHPRRCRTRRPPGRMARRSGPGARRSRCRGRSTGVGWLRWIDERPRIDQAAVRAGVRIATSGRDPGTTRVAFDVWPADIDESGDPRSTPPTTCPAGRDKARVVRARRRRDHRAADTTVDLDGELLGKPPTPRGPALLGRLSGRTHQVHTGVCVLAATAPKPVSRASATTSPWRSPSPSADAGSSGTSDR